MAYFGNEKYQLADGNTLILRTAEPFDTPDIIKLIKDVTGEGIYLIHESDEYKPDIKNEISNIKRIKTSQGKIIILAFLNNKLTGYISFKNWDTRKTMHTGFLSVYIKKEFRNLGIGKLLMQRLLKWGKHNKLIKKMSLAVFSNNKNAIRLYEKLGFKIEGICPKDIKIRGRYYDSIFMYKFMN